MPRRTRQSTRDKFGIECALVRCGVRLRGFPHRSGVVFRERGSANSCPKFLSISLGSLACLPEFRNWVVLAAAAAEERLDLKRRRRRRRRCGTYLDSPRFPPSAHPAPGGAGRTPLRTPSLPASMQNRRSARRGARTLDHKVKSLALYQLSYPGSLDVVKPVVQSGRSSRGAQKYAKYQFLPLPVEQRKFFKHRSRIFLPFRFRCRLSAGLPLSTCGTTLKLQNVRKNRN